MFNRLVNYIKDNEYLISFSNNLIHIYNYNKLINITNNKLEILLTNNKTLIILGNNIIINKIENKEILLYGEITNIEVK